MLHKGKWKCSWNYLCVCVCVWHDWEQPWICEKSGLKNNEVQQQIPVHCTLYYIKQPLQQKKTDLVSLTVLSPVNKMNMWCTGEWTIKLTGQKNFSINWFIIFNFFIQNSIFCANFISEIFISLFIFTINTSATGLDWTVSNRSVWAVHKVLQLTLISSFNSLTYTNTTAT